MKEIEGMTAIFREISTLLENNRKMDEERLKRPLGRLQQRVHEVFHRDEDAEDVKTLLRKVEAIIKSFHIGNDIRQIAALDQIKNEIKAIADVTPTWMKQELKPVLTARFGGHESPGGCLPDTRVDLLSQIHTWINDISKSSPHLFALTGLAGTGKSTIA